MTGLINIFAHAGIGHLLGNLIALAIVSRRVWRALGLWRYAALFLLSGMVANAGAAALLERPVIGASGAVAGVMAAHLVLFPHSRLALPIALWVALQAVFAGVAFDFGGVAWPAHLVGTAIGAVAALVLRSTRRRVAIA